MFPTLNHMCNHDDEAPLTLTTQSFEPKPWYIPKPNQVVFVPKPNQTLTMALSHHKMCFFNSEF